MRTNLHPSDCLGFRSCVSFRPVSAHLAASCSRAHAAALYRYKEARSRAHDFASRRGIYFRAAVEAFVSGNASYAGELARKGKDENKAMHKAHMQAMLSIFQAQYVPPLSEHASLNAYSLAGTPTRWQERQAGQPSQVVLKWLRKKGREHCVLGCYCCL